MARRAADIANAYANSYLAFKRKQTVDDLLAAANEVQAQIEDLKKQIGTSVDPVRTALIQQRGSLRKSARRAPGESRP